MPSAGEGTPTQQKGSTDALVRFGGRLIDPPDEHRLGCRGGPRMVVRTTRDSWRNHSASGNVVVVEIEAKSVRALNHGAGPRGVCAAAIDRLQADGARLIGFDVVSSSSSQPTEDGARAA